jgi:small neutral amino acid transporter SnatA (MarC family)
MKLILFKDGRNRASISYNMVAATFIILSLWLLSWVILSPFGIAIPAFDVAIASGWFAPILAFYSLRRYTKDVQEKKPAEEEKGE